MEESVRNVQSAVTARSGIVEASGRLRCIGSSSNNKSMALVVLSIHIYHIKICSLLNSCQTSRTVSSDLSFNHSQSGWISVASPVRQSLCSSTPGASRIEQAPSLTWLRFGVEVVRS